MKSIYFITMHPLIPTYTLKEKKISVVSRSDKSFKIMNDMFQPRNILINKLIQKYYNELLEMLILNYINKCDLDDKEFIMHL